MIEWLDVGRSDSIAVPGCFVMVIRFTTAIVAAFTIGAIFIAVVSVVLNFSQRLLKKTSESVPTGEIEVGPQLFTQMIFNIHDYLLW